MSCINEARNERTTFLLAASILLSIILFSGIALADPSGVSIVSNTTEAPTDAPATSLTTAGGSFTTLVLNGTFQNPRWKAYVGNISGLLTLDNTGGSTIYDWNLASLTGEIYVSRNSTISWSSVSCATPAMISAEQTYLSMGAASVDNINRTFNTTVHRDFYVSTNHILNSSCRSTATYINDAKQALNENAMFQEILLTDSVTHIIYATLLNDNAVGYDGSRYDFQLIVPEDETKTTPTTYYFFAELN